MITTFDSDTALKRLDEDRFERELERRWWVDRGPHGGYLAGLLLRAMKMRVDDDERPARSLSVHFLAPPQEGTVNISTRIERSGRVLTSSSARLEQDGKLMGLALATFSSNWPGLDYAEQAMPAVAPPEDIAPAPHVDGLTPAFFKNFDGRFAVGELPFTSAPRALSGGWMRTAEPRLLDEIALAVICDAWFPSIFTRLGGPVPVPTVDYTVHFRTALPLDGGRPEDFCLAVFRSESAQDGFFVEDGDIWSAEGRLLAQSRQLGIMLRKPSP